MKTQCFFIDPTNLIWTYPQFQSQGTVQPNQHRLAETEEEDTADFNDLETDERFNNDII